MKILLASSFGADLSLGGAEKAIADLHDGLIEIGHEVDLVSAFPVSELGPPPRVTLSARWPAGRERLLPSILLDARDVAAWGNHQFLGVAQALRPDAIVTGNLPGLTTASWRVGTRLGIPVVHDVHDYFLLCRRMTLVDNAGRPCPDRPICALRSHALLRWAGAVGHVFANSQYVADRHRGLFPNARVEAVSNPGDYGRLPEFEAPRALRTIGYIGRLDELKGVDILLRAAPSMRRAGVRLIIAGRGSRQAAVERSAAVGDVDYRGFVAGDEKLAFLRECDAGVAPAIWPEPGGPTLAIGEWLAAGRPVLATLRGGQIELAEEGHGVIGFEPTPEALTALVRDLQDDACFDRVSSSVDRDFMPTKAEYARRHVDVIEDLIAGREPGWSSIAARKAHTPDPAVTTDVPEP